MRSPHRLNWIAALLAGLAGAWLGAAGCAPSTTGPAPAGGTPPAGKVSAQDAALLAAVTRGDVKAATRALDRGASPNAREASPGSNGPTALMKAAPGRPELVRLLLDRGADLKARDAQGRTALHWSAALDCVKALIDAGADVNARDRQEQTPLHVMVGFGNSAAMRMLLAAGADPNVKDAKGLTPLHLRASARNFQTDVVKMLVAGGARIEERDPAGDTPLLAAVRLINLKAVADFLEHGADANALDRAGESPLLMATRYKVMSNTWNYVENRDRLPPRYGFGTEIGIVKLLLANRADPNSADRRGVAPLHIAAGSDGETADLLLKAGARIGAVDGEGLTALHCAARDLGFREMIEFLIKAGADPNAAAKDGRTPLMMLGQSEGRSFGYAVYRGMLSAAEKRPKKNGGDKLTLAEVRDAMVPRGVAGCREWLAGKRSHAAAALVEKGADLNARDRQGLNALDHALLNYARELAGLLVVLGMDKKEVRAALERRQERRGLVLARSDKVPPAPLDGALAKDKHLAKIYPGKDPLPNLRQTSMLVQELWLDAAVELRGDPELARAWREIKSTVTIDLKDLLKDPAPPPAGEGRPRPGGG